MHILWLKTELLHPVDKGGRIRTYQMLRALKQEHRITYLALDDGTAAPDAAAKADEYCHELVRVPFAPARKGSPAFYLDLARNLVSPLPYAVARYQSGAMRRAIVEAVRRKHVDVVVCDFLAPSVNVPGELGVPAVLFQHNVESMIWERHAQVATGAVRKWYMGEQWRRMQRHEASECRRFDQVIAVSPQDAEVFRSQFGVERVSDVPTGVDVEYFSPRGLETQQGNRLVFTGSMDWMPNEDAMLWFVEAILPRVRARVPDVTLSIVGRNPPARIRALGGHDGVEVTGSVPDVRPYLERAAAFIVPIRIGGGTRLKIFEAMSMGRAVISTAVGAEGLPVTHGVDTLLADDPVTFADAVVAVLQDPDHAARLGARAAAKVRAEFGWQAVADRFAKQCALTLRTEPADRAPAVVMPA